MTIKTITCHDVYNSGASLQAYALQHYLETLGHDVEIIDYKPEYLDGYYLWGHVSGQYNRPILRQLYSMAKFPGRLKSLFGKRKINFDRFKSQYLKITKKRYRSNSDLMTDVPIANVYFAGSDQIWNTLFNNGHDPAFYLDFALNTAVKASYAASFATEDIQTEYRSFVGSHLKKLDYISVRESSGINILHTFDLDGINVVDPVFLLDSVYWKSMVPNESEKKEPYIFVYAFEGGQTIKDFALKLSAEKGLKIFTLQKLDYGDKSFPNAGPLEFLDLIYHADYVLSNSFHATAFSIVFHKQFWVFNRTEGINTRMRDLTALLHIENRLVCCENDMKMDEKIDYSKADVFLQKAITKSKSYIDMVINSGKKTHQYYCSGI